MNDTWNKVMAKKPNDDMKHGIANTLALEDIDTIAATVDFFGGNWRQDVIDLRLARFRVFDWLAMRVQGRHSGSNADRTATKVLVHSFLKADGVTSKFIEDLRSSDYDVDHSWENIELVE